MSPVLVVARWREAARRMTADPDPTWAPVRAWLLDTADDADTRRPHQDPVMHAAYLGLGGRAHATAVADAYLTAVREGATP